MVLRGFGCSASEAAKEDTKKVANREHDGRRDVHLKDTHGSIKLLGASFGDLFFCKLITTGTAIL